MVRTKDLEGPGHNRTTPPRNSQQLGVACTRIFHQLLSMEWLTSSHPQQQLATADGCEGRKLNFKGCGPFEVNHTSVNGLIPMHTDSTSWMQWEEGVMKLGGGMGVWVGSGSD